MHSPLLRLNATIAVIVRRRVIGVETPAAMFRRRGHGGRLLSFSLAVTRISGGDAVVAADDGVDGAVGVADVQGGERRRRRRQLLGGGSDGAAG